MSKHISTISRYQSGTRTTHRISPAVVRFHETAARLRAIKEEVIERYTAAAVELATLRATDPLNERIEQIEDDYPWIDEDFPPSSFEPEYDELDYDCELSNRFEGVTR